jgi:hypothetical protein
MIFCVINNVRHKYLNLKELQSHRGSIPPFGITILLLSIIYAMFIIPLYFCFT